MDRSVARTFTRVALAVALALTALFVGVVVLPTGMPTRGLAGSPALPAGARMAVWALATAALAAALLARLADRRARRRGARALGAIREAFIADMEDVAPDLRSNGLARRYAEALFAKIAATGARTHGEVLGAGEQIFYHVGRDVLGPLAAQFVDAVLRDAEGRVVFPARDATPFFHIARVLVRENPRSYALTEADISNPVFNRKLWGIDDELDPESEVLPLSHPYVQRLLAQIGVGSDAVVTFVEVGAWGTMIDQLKRHMPHQRFKVYFFFTHLPEHIFGYINIHGKAHRRRPIPDDVLETIADSWEAFPKWIRRQTTLVEEDGVIVASTEGKVVDSPYLKAWANKALAGVEDAARAFIRGGHADDPYAALTTLWQHSLRARRGEFTGILPDHTLTWTEGDAWRANWPWGRIPPL